MDTIYSLTLALALIFGALGAAISLSSALGFAIPGHFMPRGRTNLSICLLTTLTLGALSLAVHFKYGHGLTSGEPMQLPRFVSQHKAYWLVALLCAVMFFGLYFWADRQSTENNGAA